MFTPAMALAISRAAVPWLQRAAEEVATHPNTVSAGKRTGEVVGGLIGLGQGGPVTGAPLGMIAGEKSGELAAKTAQRLAVPVAKIGERLAPYAQAISTLSGAQGVNDIAQMAEPTRRDIGFMGIGATQYVPGQQPALVNLLLMKLSEAVQQLMARGMSQGEALKTIMNQKVKGQ